MKNESRAFQFKALTFQRNDDVLANKPGNERRRTSGIEEKEPRRLLPSTQFDPWPTAIFPKDGGQGRHRFIDLFDSHSNSENPL